MNLYKSKIIKSESVRVVERTGDSSADAEDKTPHPGERNVTAAQDRFQLAIREAFEKGMAEGLRKGKEAQARESSSALKAAEDAVRQTARLRTSIVERSEDEILGLVFAIAEKVIHHEVSVNRDIVKGVLKSAVEAINDRESIKVRCNPGDLDALNEIRPELLATVDGLSTVTFVEDPSITPGGVRIEAGTGEVDARMDRQFEVIKNAILS